jgi:anti-sigma regulatory factor (Ser/Thr protein kinase)
LTLRLHPEAGAVAIVRVWVQDHCLELQDPDLCHDVVLIASELVTNAIRHAGTEVLVEVQHLGRAILLAVTDKSTRPIHRRQAISEDEDEDEGEGGRGLSLIETLATRGE